MLSLITGLPRRLVARRRRSVRLDLEPLGARDCPSALAITSFTATTLAPHSVRLSGTVTDDNPTSVRLSFGGAMMGSATADANGNFSYTGYAARLGTVMLSAIDSQWQLVGSSTTISDVAPALTLQIANGTRNNVILSGQVTADGPGGLAVTFTGVVSGSTTTNSDGTFKVTLPASRVGQVQATVTDGWGQISNAISVTVSSAPPSILNFRADLISGTTWVFTGSVSDESAPGLTVHFGGLPSLEGKSITVGDDGTFSFTVALAPGEEGMATALCTDWFGLQSDLASDWVQS
jgi:large repetitive protein